MVRIGASGGLNIYAELEGKNDCQQRDQATDLNRRIRRPIDSRIDPDLGGRCRDSLLRALRRPPIRLQKRHWQIRRQLVLLAHKKGDREGRLVSI